MDDSRAKKLKTKKTALVIACVVMVLISIPFGLVLAQFEIRFSFVELYIKDITLAEDIVLDDKYILEKYGEPVTIPAGSIGKVQDMVCYLGDQGGYENMPTRFTLPDNEWVTVYITIDPEHLNSNPGSSVYQLTDVNDLSSVTKEYVNGSSSSPNVIDIQKIESYQTIREEYINTREKYASEVRNCKILCLTISFIISVVLSLVLLLISKRTQKERKISVLLFITICIDIAIVIILFDKYLLIIKAV